MAKERPIFFSGPMVRAILTGLKVQTRRVCKDLMAHPPPQCQPACNVRYNPPSKQWQRYGGGGVWIELRCPYGVPGDALWVKEGLRCSESGVVTYVEDHCPVMRDGESDRWHWKYRGLSGLFMPRWASRITLEVTDVRVERVQEISVDDAIAEGVWIDPPDAHGFRSEVRLAFRELWDSINAKRGFGWEANPWIWIIAFKRVRDDG